MKNHRKWRGGTDIIAYISGVICRSVWILLLLPAVQQYTAATVATANFTFIENLSSNLKHLIGLSETSTLGL